MVAFVSFDHYRLSLMFFFHVSLFFLEPGQFAFHPRAAILSLTNKFLINQATRRWRIANIAMNYAPIFTKAGATDFF